MQYARKDRWALGRLIAVLGLAVPIAAIAVGPGGNPASTQEEQTAPPFDTSLVQDTGSNLVMAFANEVNIKHRYEAAAKQADLEGYPQVARLFRACAQAEQVHADRHVYAIAWSGGEAMAKLERLALGTTAQNLEVAVTLEEYEAQRLYPALLARARADGDPRAVRSMTFALSAEREHARLLRKALETLEQRAAAGTVYVCPYCGKTVESLDFTKCPNCFTGSARFIRAV